MSSAETPSAAAEVARAAKKGFTIAAVGDLVMSQPPARSPESEAIAQIFRQADVTIANAEMPIVDFRSGNIAPASHSTLLAVAEPPVAPFLGWLGVDLVSVANNHSMNFGAEGARETIRRLSAEGIEAAGYGETRAAARTAGFYAKASRRVGLVSATSSFARGNEATDPVGGIRGTPGLSAVHTHRYDVVSQEQMNVLRTIRDSHNQGTLSDHGPVADNELILNNARYRVGDRPATNYAIDEADQADLMGAIRTGKQRADYIVAALHHDNEPTCADPIVGDSGSAWPCPEPADFVETIARASIDAGADAFVGHGPHVLLGIEIYKGKPIFYSLGNMFMQPEAITNFKDRYPPGLDHQALGKYEIFRRFFASYTRDETLYESVIAVTQYKGDRVSEIRLHPLDLRWDAKLAERGVPRLASPELAQKILRRLQSMSARYGTKIALENNIGVIRLD